MQSEDNENIIDIIPEGKFLPQEGKTILGLKKGKHAGRPPANVAKYLEKISPLLMDGMKLTTACKKAGVPTSTVNDWYKKSAEFRNKVDELMNYSYMAATSIVQNAMYGKDVKDMNLQEKDVALKVAIWYKQEASKEQARIDAMNKGVDRASKDVLTEEEKEKTDDMIGLLFGDD